MSQDEPFPLEAVPWRVRYALLLEFKGRCPSLREVDQIPDKHWLTVPGMGPASLEMVRSIIKTRVPQAPSHAASHNLSDAQLLRRLEQLQEDLSWLEAQLKARMHTDTRRKPHRQHRKQAVRNDTDNPGHQSDGPEAPSSRKQRGYVA
ncbi:hypothetical protein AAII07_52000 [Microvirga sp. 0TCS3.31]